MSNKSLFDSFRQCVTFSEHGQLISFFKENVNSSLLLGFCYMETWGPTSKDATTNRLGDHKPKNLIETSL